VEGLRHLQIRYVVARTNASRVFEKVWLTMHSLVRFERYDAVELDLIPSFFEYKPSRWCITRHLVAPLVSSGSINDSEL
jgi:hypothetical protein